MADVDNAAQRDLIVFDGNCLLCGGSVGFLYRRDRHRLFRYVPLQSDAGGLLAKRFDLDPADPTTFVAVLKGEPRYMSDGVLGALQRLGGFWRIAIILRLVPPFLRNAVYRLVARNRYRWFGQRTCRLSDEPWRDLMIEKVEDLPSARVGDLPA